MIKRKNWTKKMLAVAACAGLLMTNPAFTEAATAAERSAYQAVFDADYYRSAYPDVAAAFGNNKAALFNHFVNYGLREGRSCSADFNPQAYRAKYADLQQAFGDDMAAYCRHYVTCGKAEGRDGGGTGSVSATTQTSAATVGQGNILSSCTTQYDATVPRANNVELAAARINGVIVQPGKSFSFSSTILPRTAANGYVVAPIYISGTVGTGTGGGVCQVSSTLYAAMRYANLPATERYPHSLPVTYLPDGYDAAIAGTSKDLKFTNTFSQPLLIQASASGGTLTVTLTLQ